MLGKTLVFLPIYATFLIFRVALYPKADRTLNTNSIEISLVFLFRSVVILVLGGPASFATFS